MQRLNTLAVIFTALPLLSALSGCATLRPSTTPTELYLRGDFNSWFSPQDKFKLISPGQRILEKQLVPGRYQFVISDQQGSCQTSLGNRAPDFTYQVLSDSAFTLSPCQKESRWSEQDNSMTLIVPEAATYHFTLKTYGSQPRLVVIKGHSPG